MLRTFCRWTCATLLTGCLVAASAATADEPKGVEPQPLEPQAEVESHELGSQEYLPESGVHGHPDLFHNYWVPPNCGALGARLYVAPQPVPPVVGHTYITYQPLMPHEMLYPHHHTYYRYYDGGRGMTRAKVVYYRPPVRSAVGHVITHFRIPR
jgi:hypothetical protein